MKDLKKLLDGMSLKEKIGQTVQYGKMKEEQNILTEKGEIGSFLNFFGSEIINKTQNKIMTSKNPVPLIFGDDVIHGYRTIFPIPLALSCSWNTSLIEETCAISSREAAEEGINMIFAPMVDIARDPRWGRVAEGNGEDTYLCKKISAARVKGIERNDWDDIPKVCACVKHYIGYGAAEGGRDYNSVDMSERTLREFYLPPFEEAVRAGCGSLMVSFNDFNGIPSSVNHFLVNKILREELKFEGVIVSDWESIKETEDGIKRSVLLAQQSDTVVLMLGESREMSGENHNISKLELPSVQKKLLRSVYEVNKNIAIVLFTGRPLALEEENELSEALLMAWHLGDEAGNAVKKVLTGEFNPGGKLTITFPRTTGQIPIYYNHKNTGRPSFKNYLDTENTPLFPFGFGMSYTEFEYYDFKINKEVFNKDEKIQLSVKIKNKGSIYGEEICQVYINDPAASFSRPVKQLVRFKKINLLPGESKEINFELNSNDYSYPGDGSEIISDTGLLNIFIGKDSETLMKKTVEII